MLFFYLALKYYRMLALLAHITKWLQKKQKSMDYQSMMEVGNRTLYLIEHNVDWKRFQAVKPKKILYLQNFSIPPISQIQFCPVVNLIPIRPLANLNSNINMPLNPFLPQNIGFNGMVPFNGMMPSVSLLPQFY